MHGPAPEIIRAMKAVTQIPSDRRRSLGKGIALITVAIMIAAAMMAAAVRQPARGHSAAIMLLYVGADDCAPCRAWRGGDGAAFLASTEFAGITYREIRSPRLKDVLSDTNWPEDIRDYRNRIRQSDGVPLWLIIADHTVVEQQFGTAAWQEHVLPALKSYLR
jgi:hypothetical protein